MKQSSPCQPAHPDTPFFFRESPLSLPLYLALEERILAELPETRIRVQKTQISFSNRRNFAFASLLPARRAAARPSPFLTVTIGLPFRLDSPRVDAALEPYPDRWTHHIVIGSAEEIDGELLGWIREASEFSAQKR